LTRHGAFQAGSIEFRIDVHHDMKCLQNQGLNILVPVMRGLREEGGDEDGIGNTLCRPKELEEGTGGIEQIECPLRHLKVHRGDALGDSLEESLLEDKGEGVQVGGVQDFFKLIHKHDLLGGTMTRPDLEQVCQ
jgi:hypothetical protein